MITREEAKERMDFDSNAERLSTKRNNELIDIIYDSFEQHIKSLEAQLANTEQLACEYKEDNDIYMGTVYNFNCGYFYVTIEGDLKENGVNYCPSCGGKITSKDTQ